MTSPFSIAPGNMVASPQKAPPVLHHIGFVVYSIQTEIEGFAASVGAHWNGEIFEDPWQQARVAFLQSASPTDASIELVEPAAENSPVSHFLQRGGGLHHLCYEVDDLEEELKLSRVRGGLVVKPPLPAVAFHGRQIAWVVTRHRLIIEFLERRTNKTPGPGRLHD